MGPEEILLRLLRAIEQLDENVRRLTAELAAIRAGPPSSAGPPSLGDLIGKGIDLLKHQSGGRAP